MSTTHTTGRILFLENGEDNQHAMLTEDGRLMLALLAPRLSIAPGPHRANFRRLAACWNACEGISTEALETGPTMMAAHQREQDRADKAEAALELLQNAIRSGTGLDELNRMIGPTAHELELAKARVAQMEALAEKCDWGAICPTPPAQRARESWNRIANTQADYENRYY